MRYKKVTVVFMDDPDSLTYTQEFNDAVLMVAGDHLVITEHSEDGNSITGQVFPLRTVHSYKANKE